jgi:hypothetical protein
VRDLLFINLFGKRAAILEVTTTHDGVGCSPLDFIDDWGEIRCAGIITLEKHDLVTLLLGVGF